MKKKVLFLMQLPPPVHGASMMNMFIKESELINNYFHAHFVDISPESKTSGLGKFTFKKFFKTFGILYAVISAFLSFKPNLVYFAISPHGFAFYKDALIVLLLKLMGAKLVYHLHGKGIKSEVKNKIKKIIYKCVFKNVDVIHLAEKLLVDIDLITDKTTTTYILENGVPDDYKEYNRDANIPTFLYLSNFIPSKGAHILLEAINNLDNTYKDKFRLKLIGGFRDQSYKNKLDQAIAEKFSDSIEFIGPAYGKDKNEALSQSDVFILPTKYKNECFPLSILEGMCHGLAVVSTYEGAIPNIIDDKLNGRLFDANNPSLLTEILRQYIEEPELLMSHKTSARSKFLSHYELSVFEKNLCSILSQILNKNEGQ